MKFGKNEKTSEGGGTLRQTLFALPSLRSGHLTAGIWLAYARPNWRLRHQLHIPAKRYTQLNFHFNESWGLVRIKNIYIKACLFKYKDGE